MANLQGVVKQTLSYSDSEGEPTLVSVSSERHMAAVTTKGILKLYTIHKIRTEQDGSSVKFLDLCSKLTSSDESSKTSNEKSKEPPATKLNIKSLRINTDGTRVSALLQRQHGSFFRFPSSRVYVYERDTNAVRFFDFGPERYPITHFWDRIEPRLLACQAVLTKSASDFERRKLYVGNKKVNDEDEKDESSKKSMDHDDPSPSSYRPSSAVPKSPKSAPKSAPSFQAKTRKSQFQALLRDSTQDAIVATLFSTPDGLRAQDAFPIRHHNHALVGMSVPRLLFLTFNQMEKNKSSSLLKSRLMRDFIGLDNVDETTRDALLEFSYNVTVGRLDEAFNAVRKIDSPLVWQNMSHMCVKTKRLDVVATCFGNMGHARGK